jgi:hypothetical protein
MEFVRNPGRRVEFRHRIGILSGLPSVETVTRSCGEFARAESTAE